MDDNNSFNNFEDDGNNQIGFATIMIFSALHVLFLIISLYIFGPTLLDLAQRGFWGWVGIVFSIALIIAGVNGLSMLIEEFFIESQEEVYYYYVVEGEEDDDDDSNVEENKTDNG